jgi:hypothetical protein
MAMQAYRYGFGVKDSKGNAAPVMPEPYHFLWGSTAMGIAGLVAMANARLGLVMAWGFMLGAFVWDYQNQKTLTASTAANANPSAAGLTNPTSTSIVAKQGANAPGFAF